MSTCLVSGFIGFHPCAGLIAVDSGIRVLDDLPRGKSSNLADGAELMEGDAGDPAVVRPLSACDAVSGDAPVLNVGPATGSSRTAGAGSWQDRGPAGGVALRHAMRRWHSVGSRAEARRIPGIAAKQEVKDGPREVLAWMRPDQTFPPELAHHDPCKDRHDAPKRC